MAIVDNICEDWWSKWRQADYSWEGLLKHQWQGWVIQANGVVAESKTGRVYGQALLKEVNPATGRDANLQDYWRANPNTGKLRNDLQMQNELVVADGYPTFHKIHLPLAYADGTLTAKTTWSHDFLDDLVRNRLNDSQGFPHYFHQRDETLPDIGFSSGFETDTRSQYNGAVLNKLPFILYHEKVPISLSCSFAAFYGNDDFEDTFFRYGTVLGQLNCQNAAFSASNSFDRVKFSGDVNFEGTTFYSDASFNNTEFSSGANFKGTVFLDNAWFLGVVFFKGANFDGAKFMGHTNFDAATFSSDNSFRSRVTFLSTSFSSFASFDSTRFNCDASFGSAIFASLTRFDDATFSRSADFSSGTFYWDTSFRRAAFCGPVSLRNTVFGGDVTFLGIGTELTSGELVQIARLGDERTGSESDKDFRLITPASILPKASRSFADLDASEAVFFGDTEFSNRDFVAPSKFDGALFFGAAAFHGCKLHQGVSFKDTNFESPLSTLNFGLKGYWQDFLGISPRGAPKLVITSGPVSIPEAVMDRLFSAYQTSKLKAGEARLSEEEWRDDFDSIRGFRYHIYDRSKNTRVFKLEACYRTLKLAMEENRDRAMEGYFFKLELKARRKRRDKDVPWWERVVSHMYEAVSDFGLSILRPLAWLFVLSVVMGGVFYSFASVLDSNFQPFGASVPEDKLSSYSAQIGTNIVHDVYSALTFSFNNVFRPFSALSAEGIDPKEPSWAASLLYGYGPGLGLGVRLLATFQSLASIMLVFLFGLAMRRRFQMN